MPYTIEETYDEKITNLDESYDDNVIDEDVKYWVAPDCEEWIEYYRPYKTLGEAKVHARECINTEHCHVHINKSFKKVVKEG